MKRKGVVYLAIYHNDTIIPESTGTLRHVSQNTTDMRLALYNTTVIWRKGNEVTYVWNGTSTTEYFSQGSDVLNPASFIPTKPGRQFLGWSNNPSSTETLQSLVMGVNPITLYAVWLYKHPDADLGYGSPSFQSSWNPAYGGMRIVTVSHNGGVHIDTGAIVSYDGSIYEGLVFDAKVDVSVLEGGAIATNAYGGVTLNNVEESGAANTAYRKWIRHSGWDSSGTGQPDDPLYPGYKNATVTVLIPSSEDSEDFMGLNTLYWIFQGYVARGSFELISTITAIGRTIKEVG